MKDRYLFKAKRIDNGEWGQGYYAYYPNGFGSEVREDHIIKDTIRGRVYFIDPATLCQCTCLKDKNGNLIWENDVVRHFADCDEMGNDLYFFYQIKYDEKCARFYGHEIYVKENELFDELDDIEVMGNIFDNPELLEVEL